MEWKKFGYGSRVSSLVATTMELRKLASTIKSRRATMLVSGFAFTLMLCSVFLAFSYPYKLVMNPMLQKQSWFPSLFGSGSDNYSHSDSIFSFIFSSTDSCGSAVCHPPMEDSKEGYASDTVIQKTDEENISGDGMKRNASNENGAADIVGTSNTKNATIFLNSTGMDVVQGDLNKTACSNCTDGKGHRTERASGVDSALEVVSKQDKISPQKPAKLLSSSPVVKPGVNTNSTQLGAEEISNVSSVWVKHCDIFSGRWVRDDSNPHYPPGSCPHIDESFDCFRNKRLDNQYEKWRWQPSGCTIPRLNAKDMLERLRGKRLVFVGDSLNRNMWESMVCILRHAVSDKSRVHEISGRKEFRTEGFYAFRYEDYNCSVEFIRAPFLVQEWEMIDANGTKKETLRLDLIESSAPKYVTADIIVFNTAHWWTHEKTSKGKDYYQEGDHVYPELNVLEAYRKALLTWAKWVDQNINSNRTQVFFRGYSATHFSGGQWNSGGRCHKEYEPIYNQSYLTKYPPKMVVLESVIKEMRTPVTYLNITRITDYRKDGHPSIYRKHGLTQQEMIESERYQDCSHWCLPGVPDTWNELLYASLVMRDQSV